MKLVESGNVGWDEPDVAKVLGEAARLQSPSVNNQQQSFDPSKPRELAPSARLTKCERAKIPQIYRDLVSHGITPERWELEALARGVKISFGEIQFSYSVKSELQSFSMLCKF